VSTGRAGEGGGPGPEERLDEIIASYLEAVEKGEAPAEEELLSRHPEFAAELKSFLRHEQALRHLIGSSQEPGAASKPGRDNLAGLCFGRYVILSCIAGHGAAEVYKVFDVQLKRRVALKVVRLVGPTAHKTAARFKVETRAVAMLDHPNIIPIYDVGEEEGVLYFSMKWAKRGSLKDHLLRFGTDMPTAARLVARIARAVHAAHKEGIIHRDLKPSNVLLDAEDNPMVADFGLAKILSDDVSLTGSEGLVGTPAYLPPEQIEGGRSHLGPAADIYGLGAILYELLVGRPPFHADSSLETIRQVMSEDPVAPSRLRPGIPRDLEIICLKCLAKNPSRRYLSAEALAEDLERFLSHKPIRARPPGPVERIVKWARRHPGMAAVTVVFLAAVSAVLSIMAHYTGKLSQRAYELAVQEKTTQRYLYTARMRLVSGAVSGGDLYYASQLLDSLRPLPRREDLRGLDWGLFYSLCNQARLKLTGHTDDVMAVAFLPGGDRLVSVSLDGTLRLWSLSKGSLQKVLESPDGGLTALAVCKDGSFAATGAMNGTVRLWDLRAGRSMRKLCGHRGRIRALAFSPDCNYLVSGGVDGVIRLSDLTARSEPIVIGQGHGKVWSLAVAPTGGKIFAGTDRGDVLMFKTGSGELVWRFHEGDGTVRSLAVLPKGDLLLSGYARGSVQLRRVGFSKKIGRFEGPQNSCACWALSPAGSYLAVGGDDRLVRLLTIPDLELVNMFRQHGAHIRAMAFSPDGRFIASGGLDRTILIWDLRQRPQPASFTYQGAFFRFVAFAGREVVAGSKEGRFLLWDPERITPGEPRSFTFDLKGPCLAVSPDARWILSAPSRGGLLLWEVSWRDRKEKILRCVELKAHPGGAVDAVFPKDNVFVSAGRDGKICIWKLSADGLWRPSSVLNVGFSKVSDLCLSHNGRLLALACEGDPVAYLWDVEKGRAVAELKAHTKWVIAFAFSRDDRLFATGSIDRTAILWDLTGLREGAPVRKIISFPQATRPVAGIVFGPYGKVLITVSDEEPLRFWDLKTYEERASLPGLEAEVFKLLLSPDGTRVAAAGGDRQRNIGRLKVWSTAPLR